MIRPDRSTSGRSLSSRITFPFSSRTCLTSSSVSGFSLPYVVVLVTAYSSSPRTNQVSVSVMLLCSPSAASPGIFSFSCTYSSGSAWISVYRMLFLSVRSLTIRYNPFPQGSTSSTHVVSTSASPDSCIRTRSPVDANAGIQADTSRIRGVIHRINFLIRSSPPPQNCLCQYKRNHRTDSSGGFLSHWERGHRGLDGSLSPF